MDHNFDQYSTSGASTQSAAAAFISQVFTYMAGALALSGAMAYLFATNPDLSEVLRNPLTGGPTGAGWAVALSPLLFVFLMNSMIERMSARTMLLSFIAVSVLIGMSLSSIFFQYSQEAISSTFFITAGTFAIMAFVGYTTKTDLTKIGMLLTMAFIGLFISSMVNIFLIQSSGFDLIISCAFVLVIIGLIAYKTQMLKEIGAQVGTGNEMATKQAILGALSLYISFINLFLFLLRLFGGRSSD